MTKRNRIISLLVLILVIVGVAAWYLSRHTVDVLAPRGPVGHQERELIIIGVLLAVIVVLPVFILTGVIAWRYREDNKSAKYQPDWDHNPLIEFTWWAIPSAIILVLSIVTWNSSHSLDPYRPLSAASRSMTIDVISLDWKWLFIYPKQDIASVNFVQIPVNTPVDFEITSDSVMNSFWIPQLGGQIYSMPGMLTQLHLLANQPGNYYGSSANISGKGFSDMHFTAKASSWNQFDSWVSLAKQSPSPLNMNSYNKLAQPSRHNPVTYYSSAVNDLIDEVVFKYTAPPGSLPGLYTPDYDKLMNMGGYGQ